MAHMYRWLGLPKLVRSLSYPKVPLSEPLPQFEGDKQHLLYDPARATPTQITQLENGLTVASESALGQLSTIGGNVPSEGHSGLTVFVDAGSRYEVRYTSGVSHLMSKLAFNSTERFEHREAISDVIHDRGGIMDCQPFRDTIVYGVSLFSDSVEQAVEVLAEALWRPRLTAEELELGKMSLSFELQDIHMKADPEQLMQELIHQAAYRSNTLGLSFFCPEENIPKLTRAELQQYMASHFTPDRMVISATGVQHDHVVELVKKHFVNPRRSYEGVDTKPVDGSIAQYTGGENKLQREAPPVIGPNPLPDLNSVAIAMEAVDHTHDDIYAFLVLGSMMGGGGSFSAGGPGKGMYTQLYRDVLNQHHWIYSALAQNFVYKDGGIFSLFGSASPRNTRSLVEVLCRQFFQMATRPDIGHLNRAKQQLKSTILMNLESRLVQFEDIGRQVLMLKKRLPPEVLIEKIDQVTPLDIERIGQRMLCSRVSYAALGNLQHAPSFQDVEKGMIYDGKLPKLNKLFTFS